jgi:hypothetical protein
VVGLGKGLIGAGGITHTVEVGLVGAQIRPDQRRAIVKCCREIGLGLAQLPVDIDQFGGILCLGKTCRRR